MEQTCAKYKKVVNDDILKLCDKSMAIADCTNLEAIVLKWLVKGPCPSDSKSKLARRLDKLAKCGVKEAIDLFHPVLHKLAQEHIG